MKRALILLVTLLVATPLALGIMAGLAYYGTREEHIPAPVITMLEQSVKPCGYEWRSPVFGGLIYRDFEKKAPARIQDIGALEGASFNISVPEGYEVSATLTRMGETVWSGRASDLTGYQFVDNGRYRIFVECVRPGNAEQGQGTLHYQGAFTVTVDPRYEASDEWVAQGDVLAIRIFNLSGAMQAHGELGQGGQLDFMVDSLGQATVYIPIGHDHEPGSNAAYAGAGNLNWEIPFRVTDGSFPTRRVELEAGENWPLNASDAPEDQDDYMEQVWPLLSQRDTRQYWEGTFTLPVSGEVGEEYGTYIYVNDAQDPVQHPGIDVAAERGTEVSAMNHGRVVFAGELESTGNTVIIEHGGGLKSLYFHLDSLKVQSEDMVIQGQVIGSVGSTGLCRQPHLHYEVRLGTVTLNPTLLVSGTSRLFYFS